MCVSWSWCMYVHTTLPSVTLGRWKSFGVSGSLEFRKFIHKREFSGRSSLISSFCFPNSELSIEKLNGSQHSVDSYFLYRDTNWVEVYRSVNVAFKRAILRISLYSREMRDCLAKSFLLKITHAIRTRLPLTVLSRGKLPGLRHKARHSKFYGGIVCLWCSFPLFLWREKKRWQRIRPETLQRFVDV